MLSATAGVAVERNVPLVVVPCGTRNHFAKDCGADITDPAGELTAIEAGGSRRSLRDSRRYVVFLSASSMPCRWATASSMS
jgi:hypothetical protein